MIGFLQGKILDNSVSKDGKLLVGVGSSDAGQVGYLVSVPKSSHYEAALHHSRIELYIYTHVREDSLDLYGFASTLEKELFLTLLSVNGIGPKVALAVLSHSDAQQLLRAVMQGDKDFLTSIPGIGKKTAERVVLELKDTMQKRFGDQLVAPSIDQLAQSRAGKNSHHQVYMDAKAALMALGFPETKISIVLDKSIETSLPSTAEELIRMALQQL